MTTHRTVFLLAITFALGFVPATAQAQPSSAKRDQAAAEVLFRAALDALDKDDWGAACTKFNASMDLDPAVSTLINVAKCHEHEGKLAIAWAELNRALVLNGETVGAKRKAELEVYAKGLIAALEPRLPKLTIVVRNKPAGLEVTRDGLKISGEVLGEALPIDPGTHEITATAPGYTTDKRTVDVVEGKAVTVELSMVVSVAPEGRSSRRGGAYVVGGVGLAGLVLGGVTGGLTIGKKGVIDENCGPATVEPRPCNDTGLNSAKDSQTLGLVSTIGFGVGAAGVVTAVVLLLTEPKRAPAASLGFQAGVLSAGREGATFGIRGVW